MSSKHFSRRTLLQASAAAFGASQLTRLTSTAFGQSLEPEKPALLLVWLDGGYNSLFGSPDSFLGSGAFGVNAGNVLGLGNGLSVDRPTFGQFPALALSHMASIGVRHGLSAHENAQPQMWSDGNRSYALRLANELGGTAPIKAAVMGGRMPPGSRTAENGISYQGILDLKSTITALGGAPDPSVPDREIAARSILAAQTFSSVNLRESPRSLATVSQGYTTTIETLQKPVPALDYNALATAYNVNPTATSVNNFTMQMVGAELMIRAGANVVVTTDGGWDTHGDRDGNNVRNMMNARLVPPIKVFLDRMMADTTRNVVTVIFGEFARSLPGSDHQPNLTCTVIGKYVKQGTTGKVGSDVSLPNGTPTIPAFWAHLSKALRVQSDPFGANPHGLILG